MIINAVKTVSALFIKKHDNRPYVDSYFFLLKNPLNTCPPNSTTVSSNACLKIALFEVSVSLANSVIISPLTIFVFDPIIFIV